MICVVASVLNWIARPVKFWVTGLIVLIVILFDKSTSPPVVIGPKPLIVSIVTIFVSPGLIYVTPVEEDVSFDSQKPSIQP